MTAYIEDFIQFAREAILPMQPNLVLLEPMAWSDFELQFVTERQEAAYRDLADLLDLNGDVPRPGACS